MAKLGEIRVPVHVPRPSITVLIFGEDSFGTLIARERVPLNATTADLSAAASRAIARWQGLQETHIAGLLRQHDGSKGRH